MARQIKVAAGRPYTDHLYAEAQKPIEFPHKQSFWKEDLLCLVALIVTVLIVTGCDGEYERLQSEADWNAKVARACLPSKTETLVNIRHLGDGYIVRRYSPYGSKQPYLSTDVLARSE